MALHKHARQLSSATSLDEIIRYTLDAIESPLGVELADFYVVDTEKKCLRLAGLRGWSPSFSELSLRGPGFTVMAANTQQTVRIPDIRKEDGYVDAAGRSGKAISTTRLSELTVPVIVEGKTVAVLNVESSQLNAFNDEDQRLLETLAIHVSSALGHLRHEEELRESEQLYRTLAESSPDDVLILRRDASVQYMNRSGLQHFGLTLEEITGKKALDLFSPEAAKKMSIPISTVFQTGKPLHTENEVSFPSAVSWRDEHWIPLKTGTETTAVLGITRDITERKLMEKTLQESEEKYRAMVENSPNMIGIFQDGVLKYVNSVAILKLGWTREELVSSSFDPVENVVSQKSRSLLKENIRKRLCGEEVAPYEISLTRKDGSEIPVFVRGAKINYNQKTAIEFVFDDVTERKQAEEKVRQSEERYRSLFDRMLDGVYLSTHAGRFVDINSALVKMFGYSSKEEMLDITDIKKELYFSPEERGRHILDTDQEEVKEYRMRKRDGSEVWVEDHGGYVHDEQGNIIYHEGILRDITERKQLEEELKQYSLHLEDLVAERTGELQKSEERYRELFEACPVSLWEEDYSLVKQFIDELRRKGITDFDAYFTNHPKDVEKCAAMVRVLHMNRATLSLYEAKSVEEITGGPSGLSRVFTEESNRQFASQLAALAQGEEYYEAEVENRTLGSETKNCNLICAVVPGYEQSLARVLVCLVDLTPQKKLDAELRAAKERLEYVVALNPAVLVLEKPLPDFSNTLSTFVSDSAISVFGFEPKNFLGKAGSDFFNSRLPPGDLAQYRAEMPSLWSNGYHTFEFRFLHSDGAYRWIREEMKVTRDAEGRILDVVGVCIDVTERNKLEEKLAKAERLAVIGETAAMVGHDLRNPLQGITGALYLLKQESLTAEERNEMLQVIEKSVHYSDAIVKDLLDYSAEIQLKPAETTPKSIIRDAIEAVKVPRNVTILDLLEDQPTVRVDPGMMRRVFVNLIGNAIDAMPQGGTLTVSSKRADGNVEIALTDTGPGISEKFMENLWKPLQTTKAKGMGLGLAICKRIVDAHGGNISVKSEVGRGTTFTIQLPLRLVEVNLN
jgi:PAS domain S-box-containing protein